MKVNLNIPSPPLNGQPGSSSLEPAKNSKFSLTQSIGRSQADSYYNAKSRKDSKFKIPVSSPGSKHSPIRVTSNALPTPRNVQKSSPGPANMVKPENASVVSKYLPSSNSYSATQFDSKKVKCTNFLPDPPQRSMPRISELCSTTVQTKHHLHGRILYRPLFNSLTMNFSIENLSDMQVSLLEHLTLGNHCFVRCPTGAGKSFISLVGVLDLLLRDKSALSLACIVVPTEQLLVQYKEWITNLCPDFLPMCLIYNKNEAVSRECLRKIKLVLCTPSKLLAIPSNDLKYLRSRLSLLFLDEIDELFKKSEKFNSLVARSKKVHMPPLFNFLSFLAMDSFRHCPRPVQLICTSATFTSNNRADLFRLGYLNAVDFRGKSVACIDGKPTVTDTTQPLLTASEVVTGNVFTTVESPSFVESQPFIHANSPLRTISHYYYLIGRDHVEAICIEDRVDAILKVYSRFEMPGTIIVSQRDSPKQVYLELLVERLGRSKVKFIHEYKNNEKFDSSGMLYVGSSSDCRGLDFKNINLIILLDPISTAADYIHIAGRMQRLSTLGTLASRQSRVVSFVDDAELRELLLLVSPLNINVISLS